MILLQALEIHVSPHLALFGSYKAWFKPIEAENLTYGKTVQLRLETSLFSSNIYKNYVETMLSS